MSQVDWSKAPAEATHYGPKREDNDMWSAVFWKVVNDVGIKAWQVDNETGDLNQYSNPTWYSEELHRLIPRPAEWIGEDLPPAGTVCEVTARYVNGGDLVKVVAHDDGEAVGRYLSGELIGSYTSFVVGELVPIRTPEQNAAYDREKAIDAMLNEANERAFMTHRELCAALYDLDYRKREPKQ